MSTRPPRETPGLTAEDAALWHRAVRADKPFPDRAPPDTPPVDASAAPPARERPSRTLAGAAANPRSGGVDGRTVQRLRRGRIPVDVRLDLHGMNQTEAHRAVTRALAAAQARDARCVLVITGKGVVGGETGVLRRMAPRWLEEPPNADRVLAHAPAVPRDGGAGAFYVLLRRSRRRPPRRRE